MSSAFVAPASLSIDYILRKNRNYVDTKFKASPPLIQRLGGDVKANGPHVIVISCMDGRTDPFEVLDCIPREIISIRNPGCQVLPHLAALSAMDTFFGINQIIIIHHNDCGTNHFTVEEHINHIQSVTPDVTAEELAFVKHGSPCRKESEESVIEDLKLLRSTNLIRKELRENSLGLYYDVKTGLVHQVE